MTAIPAELLSWAEFLSNIGQFLFGLCALALAVLATTTKRKDIFRSELAKKQLDEAGRIREELQSLFFDLYYIPITLQTMRVMEWNTDHLREYDRDAWEQVQRYRSTSLDLFYKLSSKDYYLLPDWLDKGKIKTFSEAMKPFAPFTLNSTGTKSEEDRECYANAILDLRTHFDDALRANA